MTMYTIRATCASGHVAQELKVDLPGREWADELCSIFEKGKCTICDAKLTVTAATPIDEN